MLAKPKQNKQNNLRLFDHWVEFSQFINFIVKVYNIIILEDKTFNNIPGTDEVAVRVVREVT